MSNVERRYLANGDSRLLVVVPTELPLSGNACPVLEGLEFPTGPQAAFSNLHSQPVDQAYNTATRLALDHNVDWLFTLEDDTFPPPDALVKLWHIVKDKPKTIAGAWYPKKTLSREGTPIVIKDGMRQALPADGAIHEVYTIPTGCTLIPTAVFREIPEPWFQTTRQLTQDSWFSQLARKASWTLLCDTSIICKHRCKLTGQYY